MLLLDKPVGLSSNAALQRARRALSAEKAGHTGTLDPLASGLLPLCFGEATKFAGFHLNARKRYLATVSFGVATSTGDAEGEEVARSAHVPSCADILAILPAWHGRKLQTPPAYSAIKVEGRKLYEYARAGVVVARTPREVEIHHIALVECAPAVAVLDIACSKGTYIRVLAEDIALALGSRAHLTGLRRTFSGGFDIADAIPLERLEACDAGQRDAFLLPVDRLLDSLERIVLTAAEALSLQQGRPIDAGSLVPARYRVYDGANTLLGVAQSDGTRLVSERLLRTDVRGCGAERPQPYPGDSE